MAAGDAHLRLEWTELDVEIPMVAFFNNPEEAYTAVQSYKMHLLIPASPFLLFLIISAASPLTSASVDSQFSLALT